MSLDAIGIVSDNLNESVKFYSILGVELKEKGGLEHLEGRTTSGVRIMLDSVELMKKINPDFKKGSGAGIVLCFVQDSPEKVDELVSRVKESSFKIIKEPWDAFWGQRYASVSDPDGNQIDIFANN
ncbi:MAG: putative glyoxalase superfamily protein PhnB [Bacteriovoracaceae bacterium]|jgi:uncharacterized glyoxalase superfamily protein PhnB